MDIGAALGATICCVVPLLSFAAGMFYARHGAPFAVQWRWQRRSSDYSIDAEE